MWVTALLGMGTKYCEATLAVHYREKAADGSFVGGPRSYIKNGLGATWKGMATLFAVFASIACFGIGNLTQANSITANIVQMINIPDLDKVMAARVVAGILMVLVGVTLLGGVKRIGDVAGTLVPIMVLIYVLGGLVIILTNFDKVPGVFAQIFGSAFSDHAAVGGFTGATLAMVMRFGLARGLFSNEAGLGSSPMAHATAMVKHPVKQGFLGMIDPFLDTLVVCTMTALVILIAGDWTADHGVVSSAAVLTNLAFTKLLPGTFGGWLVTIGLTLFAYSTLLGWGLYGERAVTYLFGRGASKPFYLIFTLVVPVGCLTELTFVWNFSDLFNGLMALPNLVALLLLSPVVFKLTKEYFADPKKYEDD
jgi:AGCS family alanine or glycine:cation symporter